LNLSAGAAAQQNYYCADVSVLNGSPTIATINKRYQSIVPSSQVLQYEEEQSLFTDELLRDVPPAGK
jgi:hypothetical protein